jgi:hypothetical protein
MDVIEQRFEEGEWVRIVNCRLGGCSGYIVRYDAEDDTYKIKITKNAQGRAFVKNQWINADFVMKDRHRDEDELLALIDHALDMGDKEWFLELTALLPEELPF